MTTFACSGLATNPGLGQNQHVVFVVEASNRFEADGLAMAIVRKFYPMKDGWIRHHAVTTPSDNIITLEDCELGGEF